MSLHLTAPARVIPQHPITRSETLRPHSSRRRAISPLRLLEQRFATDAARAACPMQSQAKPSSRASSRVETAQFWAIQRADAAPPRPPRVSPCRRPGLSPAGPGWGPAVLLLGPMRGESSNSRGSAYPLARAASGSRPRPLLPCAGLLKQKLVRGKLIYEFKQVPDPRQRGSVEIPIAALTPGDQVILLRTAVAPSERSQVNDGRWNTRLLHFMAL